MLKGNWGQLFNGQLIPPKIDAQVVMTAKALARTRLFSSDIDFSSYRSVKKYLVQNGVYVDYSARQVLLAPFQEW